MGCSHSHGSHVTQSRRSLSVGHCSHSVAGLNVARVAGAPPATARGGLWSQSPNRVDVRGGKEMGEQ
eukprot:1186117-Prorocentrum_minimum.AAC.4